MLKVFWSFVTSKIYKGYHLVNHIRVRVACVCMCVFKLGSVCIVVLFYITLSFLSITLCMI